MPKFGREECFSDWLSDNIDKLNELLGFDLIAKGREEGAFNYSIDVFAETKGGKPVIIENQTGPSDHNHLGKCLTYAVAKGAKLAIWLAKDFSEGHMKAIEWNNRHSDLQIKLFSFTNDAEDPNIRLPEIRETSKTSEPKNKQERIQQAFWTKFVNEYKLTDTHNIMSRSSGPKDYWKVIVLNTQHEIRMNWWLHYRSNKFLLSFGIESKDLNADFREYFTDNSEFEKDVRKKIADEEVDFTWNQEQRSSNYVIVASYETDLSLDLLENDSTLEKDLINWGIITGNKLYPVLMDHTTKFIEHLKG